MDIQKHKSHGIGYLKTACLISWGENLEVLPFTYGQYVVIELADKLYNSVTVVFVRTRRQGSNH